MSEELRPYGTDSTDPPAEPLTREEQYLSAIAGVTSSSDIPPKPLTRAEKYLNKIVENGGGGGGGGTTNYNELSNRPQVNNKTLEGNMSLSDLGAQAALDTNQMAAVNSGVTSTDVEQIATNKNNISTNEQLGYLHNYNLSPIVGGRRNDAGVIDKKECFLSAGTYYVSWRTSVTTTGTATMTFYDGNDTSVGQAIINNSTTITEVSVTLTDDCEAIELTNDSNVAINIYKVMIAEMANQSFVPYAPSNAELYSTIGDINSVLEEVL